MTHMVIFKTANQGTRFALPRSVITQVWATDDENVCILEYRRLVNGTWTCIQEHILGPFYITISKIEEAR